MSAPLLSDTTLCAIVRDEMMNPAGGIRDFVQMTVPFVEEAVIVDTGSVDGTREVLEEMQATYKNLRVYDHKWNGYSDARNVSLSHAKTDRVLVLDADERLFNEDFSILEAYQLPTLDKKLYIYPTDNPQQKAFTPCFFPREGVKFDLIVWELPSDKNGVLMGEKSDAVIKHFMPTKEAYKQKMQDWYSKSGMLARQCSPSQLLSFSKWKAFNPKRLEYPLSPSLQEALCSKM